MSHEYKPTPGKHFTPSSAVPKAKESFDPATHAPPPDNPLKEAPPQEPDPSAIDQDILVEAADVAIASARGYQARRLARKFPSLQHKDEAEGKGGKTARPK